MKAIVIVIKFLLLGAFFVVSNEDLALKDGENFDEFSRLYYDWLSSLFNHGKALTGYVINVDWLPDIESDPTKAGDG